MDWIFSIKNMKQAVAFFKEQGFVGFSDVLNSNDVKLLRDSFDEGVQKGNIQVDAQNLVVENDAIYCHPVFEKYLTDERMLAVSKSIFEQDKGIVLQHAKLINKPLKTEGVIDWHQDYPFYPHTNFDLIAIGIHFDDEDKNSGSMQVIPGSHKWGVFSHLDEEKKFAYKCTDTTFNTDDAVLMTCPAGTVTVHHCLVMHQSSPKKNDNHRRFLVFQMRADDNIQISGVLWKCGGYQITEPSEHLGMAKFVDGTRVENRGINGRLFDKFQKLTPNR